MPEHFHIPDTFSPEEIRKIHEALSVLGERPMCPLCDRDLEVECVVATIMSVSWHARCDRASWRGTSPRSVGTARPLTVSPHVTSCVPPDLRLIC